MEKLILMLLLQVQTETELEGFSVHFNPILSSILPFPCQPCVQLQEEQATPGTHLLTVCFELCPRVSHHSLLHLKTICMNFLVVEKMI